MANLVHLVANLVHLVANLVHLVANLVHLVANLVHLVANLVHLVAITMYFRAFLVFCGSFWMNFIRPVFIKLMIYNSLCISDNATSFRTFIMFLQTELGGRATSFSWQHCKCPQCIALLLMHKAMCIICIIKATYITVYRRL